MLYYIITASGVFLLGSCIFFAKKFGDEDKKRMQVEDFFMKLHTPVDVNKEVSGRSKAALEVFRLVGVLTFIISAFVLVFMFIEQWIVVPETGPEPVKYIVLVLILAAMGSFFYFSAIRFQKKATSVR